MNDWCRWNLDMDMSGLEGYFLLDKRLVSKEMFDEKQKHTSRSAER